MKKQFIIALGLMVSMSTMAQKKELRTLEKAVKNNNYAEAKVAVSQLEPMLGSMDDKLKSKYYFSKAQAYYANGAGTNADFKMAINDLAKVDEKYVSEVAVIKQGLQNELLTKANSLYTTGKYSEASILFDMLYTLVPEDQVYLYYAAVSAVSAQDLNGALDFYLKLRDIGYTGIETQYIATNKETGEEEAFDKATRDLYVGKLKTHIKPREVETESKTAEITKNIALIYNSLGESEKGLEAIKIARQEDPSNVELILTEANMQYKLGNKEAYTSLIKEAIKNDPNNKDLLYNLGVLSSEAGETEQAKKYYNKVLELDPTYINAATNIAALILSEEVSIIEEMNSLGSSAADNKRYDELKRKRVEIYNEAIPYLEGVLKIDDDNIDVAKTLKGIYSAIGEDAKYKAIVAKYKI
ncbi:tetratricopeptide repeat protein [Bizionia paragorgiae]|uniref:TPR repeat-containing protein n=1 Tax=Bizionia paragorgiae TaxID=283786 RepID=A0A1H4CSK0_BIZPA|nr:tetratricopeptide repeat protein [Bizionia paragorgiae]SEA63324.1 TPR repeat-containing protein [Bizionia paragorgiae]